MKITDTKFYDGAMSKVSRLGISGLFLELLDILLSTKVHLLEETQANGAAEVRQRLDDQFKSKGGWVQSTTGDVDWIKRHRYNDTLVVRLGVEVQVSSRSDLLIRDIVHLRNSIQEGIIDAGVIVVPNDRLQEYLPDRTPCLSDAIKYAEQEFPEAMNYPIILIAVEHDGPGGPLPKRVRKS